MSDRDRVEQYWQSEILPVLEGKVDLTTACQRMINMANSRQRNGHDNSTVALVHCQVKQPVEAGQTTTLQDFPSSATAAFDRSSTLLLSSPEVDPSDTPRLNNADRDPNALGEKSSKNLILGAIGVVSLVAIGATAWFVSQGQPTIAPPIPTPDHPQTTAPDHPISPAPINSPSQPPKSK